MSVSTQSHVEAALDYAARGAKVLLTCWPREDGSCACPGQWDPVSNVLTPHFGTAIGKAPFARGGYTAATSEPETIRALWAKYPEANVGLWLEGSGMAAIDPDSAAAQAEAHKLGMPPAPVRHSRHDAYLFRLPEDCPIERSIHGGSDSKLDVLAEGHLVVYGRHRDGHAVWTDWTPELRSLPPWAVERLQQREAERNAGAGPVGEPGQPTPLSDDEVIERAKAGPKHGGPFTLLYETGALELIGACPCEPRCAVVCPHEPKCTERRCPSKCTVKPYPSESERDLALMSFLRFWGGKDPARMERLFGWSIPGKRPKWQRSSSYRKATLAKALKGKVWSPKSDDDASESDRPRKSQADLLVSIGSRAELFHDRDGSTYARLAIGGHSETWLTRSKGFKRWLIGAFYGEHAKAPGGQAVADALNVLEAKAQFEGTSRTVYVRVAPGDESALYVDLGDATWQAIRVDCDGWSIVAEAPIAFRRSPGMQALPMPVPGGRIDELRRFVNVPSDADWALVRAWLRACLRDRGPHPVLALYGEQGSAKTTLARMLRALVDPSTPDLRSDPREVRDLAIAARANWLVAFDNVSNVQPWMSDAMCRLSTGGGWATRELYSDVDEVLFDACRPVLLTGITEYIVRGDLLDRAVQITLPEIPDDARRDEQALWAAFRAAQPGLFGALLDDVSAALRELPSVRLGRLPRMADFALWAVAAERGRGETPLFLTAYAEARGQSHEQAIEASPIGPPLLALVEADGADGWNGTATQLLASVTERADEQTKRLKWWPRTARALAGELRRLAPALRGIGIQVEFERVARERRRLIRLRKEHEAPVPSASSAPSAARTSVADHADGRPPDADGRAASADGRESAADGQLFVADDADGSAADFSDASAERAALLEIGAIYRWPDLEIRPGERIASGEQSWRLFAEMANGRLSEALVAARRLADGLEEETPF